MLKNLFYIISAYAFVFGFGEYFHRDEFLGNQSIINIFLFVGAFFLLKSAFSIEDKHLKVYGGSFGALLSMALVVGNRLYVENSIRSLFTLGGLAKGIVCIWGFSTVLGGILMLTMRQLEKVETLPLAKTWKLFRHPILIAVLLFVAWLPCYLAYYPGIFSYDVEVQTAQALGFIPVTRFHPPLHTYFWRFCLAVEEGVGIPALVCSSLTQMLLLASAFSYVIRFMVKRGFHKTILLGTFLFFALNPLIAIFSFVPAKDAALAIFLILYIVEICNFLTDRQVFSKSIWCNVRLVLLGLLCSLLRNNMVYAIVIASIFMICFYKKVWKNVSLWCGSIVLGYMLINGPIYTAIGVQEGSSAEMLSVPMQQLASVVYYHEAELSVEDKEAIGEYLPVTELSTRYNFRLADTIKGDFNSERFDGAPFEFIKLWAEFLVRYPVEYIEAFLNLNLPYWYPDACSTDAYSQKMYIETYIMDTTEYGYEVVRESKLPWLLPIYEKVANYEAFRTKPIIANIFSISTPVWLLLLSGWILLVKKRRDMLLPLLPALGYWMTFMLGPVSNLRYMYPIIVLYPLYVALALQTSKLGTKEG